MTDLGKCNRFACFVLGANSRTGCNPDWFNAFSASMQMCRSTTTAVH